MFYDLDAETLQRWNVCGAVGEQADAAEAEVGENLRADAAVAQRAVLFADLSRLVQRDAGSLECAFYREAWASVVQVEESATACFGDSAE